MNEEKDNKIASLILFLLILGSFLQFGWFCKSEMVSIEFGEEKTAEGHCSFMNTGRYSCNVCNKPYEPNFPYFVMIIGLCMIGASGVLFVYYLSWRKKEKKEEKV